jgi:hypothetical protein
MPDYYGMFFLSVFFMSTPVAVVAHYVYNIDRAQCAIWNSYGFSTAMIAMYIYPFLIPLSKEYTLNHRIHKATMNWIIWLSVFTEVVFQIPHNLFVKQLHAAKGTPLEWPFYSYGLSDFRWNNYHDGTGLSPEVWLINWNDAGLGLVVLATLLFYYGSKKNTQSTIALVLATLFRDATLWRETVEYMWDHHRKDYPLTTQDPEYRPHAVLLLWLVNGIWLVAPIVTVWWAYNQIMGVFDEGRVARSSLQKETK